MFLRICLFLLSPVGLGLTLEVFTCHGDICNRSNEPEFCSEAFQHCRFCHDIEDVCNLPGMPTACSQYCSERPKEKVVEPQTRWNVTFRLCPSPPWINNANHRVTELNNQTIVKYECHVGYTAIGDTEFICLQNNTWLSRSQNTRTMPVCSKNVESNVSNYSRSKPMVACLSAVIGVLLTVVLILGVLFCKKRSHTRKWFKTEKPDEVLVVNLNERSSMVNVHKSDTTVDSGLKGSSSGGVN